MIQTRFYILIIAIIIFIGCDKNKLASNNESILGTWISLDKTDTLAFIDNTSFYKSSSSMRYDHFDYHLSKDSITIRYNGILYILIEPTIHKYTLKDNNLTLFLSNESCYGFDRKNISYSKQH